MAIVFTNGYTITSGELYPFTSFTFTNAGYSGSLGPSITQLRTAYTGSSSGSYFSNSDYFTTSSYNGHQMWTVPSTGNYKFRIAGSRSGLAASYVTQTQGSTGSGAIIEATFPLTKGEKIIMVVGSFSDATGSSANTYGTYYGFGGGGGTFVIASASLEPLLVAGGGGGGGYYSSWAGGTRYTGSNGVTTQSGSASRGGAQPGTGSLGGWSNKSTGSLNSSNAYDAGGGGGFRGNGYRGDGTLNNAQLSLEGNGGYSFFSGSMGGMASSTYQQYAGGPGGFGGGGGGNGIICGGGGGGYSGGGGSYQPGTPAADAGGGGGSYIHTTATNISTSDGKYDGLATFSGSAITNIGGYNSRAGFVTITKL